MRFDTPYNQHSSPPHRSLPAEEQASATPGGGARAWNSWWSRRSPNLHTNDNPPVRMGIDAGSKTIKLVTLDASGNIVHGLYHRHRSDVRTELAEILHEVIWRYGDWELPVAITGSAGITLANELGIPFVQEVIATTNAVKARIPQASCIIELGGEDAKITYLDDPVEQRMNATCAGGTGDFIDGIASMLGVRTREFSRLALGSTRTYPIASRCAVFAQTDVRPLINAGAKKGDIAQSALEAVVRQTLGGLSCGRPIRGTVVFLGGPLEHIPALVLAFRKKLGLTQHTGIKPTDAHLFAAMGAIETATDAPTVTLAELERRALDAPRGGHADRFLPPLFREARELAEFRARHANTGQLHAAALGNATGNLYLGFDAGSTTCKYVLIDETGALVASDYRDVEGDTFATARAMVEGLRVALSSNMFTRKRSHLVHATVTGYGEDLLRAGLGFDSGVVETVAHLRAAQSFRPDATFVLDIGGQDMKALWIRDGVVVDAVLNEACSSGCGAFVQSSAKSLQLGEAMFSKAAFEAAHPVDLGAKCTVFMTSQVRHAQKIGASAGDIAAGIAYSVVNNAMTRIIGSSHALPLGDAVVVQGGTFKSDAILRAFEKVVGVQAIRPSTAHLMGAYGAALVARERAQANREHESRPSSAQSSGRERSESGGRESAQNQNDRLSDGESSLLTLDEVRALSVRRKSLRCSGCGNACLVSVVDFGSGKRFISGNRCDRAYSALFGEPAPSRAGETGSNIVALEQKLIAAFRTANAMDTASRSAIEHLDALASRRRIRIGLLNVLNVYESTPFWHTLFTELGFSVVIPDDEQAGPLHDRAAETIPSESVCHPAKLAHVRYAHLVEQGADIVFMPRFERGTRCPVACEYACALRNNVESSHLCSPVIRAIRPKTLRKFPQDIDTLFETVNNWMQGADARAAEDAPAIQGEAGIRSEAGTSRADENPTESNRPSEKPIDSSNAYMAPIHRREFDMALERALQAQADFEATLARAAEKALTWVEGDPDRRAAIMAGRPYHTDPALCHQIDCELAQLGFAVIPLLALEGPLRALRGKSARWKPSKHLCELVEYAAGNPQIEVVALRSFGCLYDAVSFDEAHDLANSLSRPFTELKIDDIADRAHIRIRLRTLAYTSRHSAAFGKRLRKAIGARRAVAVTPTPDLCSTAKALLQRACSDPARLASPGESSTVGSLHLPRVCIDCLDDAVPFELAHMDIESMEIEFVPSASSLPKRQSRSGKAWLKCDQRGDTPLVTFQTADEQPKAGLVGNPLIVFDEDLNEHVADLVESLGWQVVYPDPDLIEIEDVRYLDQLRAFESAGVERVIYLQSFGCLKGHVKARGAAHELAALFPNMPITIVDYDPESSALNRENRIRLALAR